MTARAPARRPAPRIGSRRPDRASIDAATWTEVAVAGTVDVATAKIRDGRESDAIRLAVAADTVAVD